ncbi:Vitamin B12 import ATP-binding protein BtuD [Austwickia sp. TVS 96-490-7B]|nr:Vitamin B12 import ATP-binding protein BtuD [Austwickia sp. TVS 96-490-7B]
MTGDPQVLSVPVDAEPDGSATSLDVAVYSPGGSERRPAVVITHGFGGSREDVDAQAREIAGHGYVAMAYSARGFGRSGGRIHLMDPDLEGADVRRLIDALATRPDVLTDGPNDPRVGLMGASYGGAAALIGAGVDNRVDAVAAAITWNDLATALFPSSLVGAGGSPAAWARPTSPDEPDDAGVLRRRWASQLFTMALAGRGGGTAGATKPVRSETARLCGRFDPKVCQTFLQMSQTGRPSAEQLQMMHRHSPAAVAEKITAPTLLVQGMNDSLFGLDQADATARQLTAAGARVAVRWFDGGHDGGEMPSASSTWLPWFDTYLRGPGSVSERRAAAAPLPGFGYAIPAVRRGEQPPVLSTDRYPGLPARDGVAASAGTSMTTLPFAQKDRQVTLWSPPGGDPAAISTMPGAAAVGDGATTDILAGAGYRLAALPGQSGAFDVAPVSQAATVVGSPRVRLTVTSSTTDATLFFSWWKVTSGSASLPRRLVSPVRVATQPGVPTTVEVALPAGTYALEPGATWRMLVSATDASFATPTDARQYVVRLADDALSVPTLPGVVAPPAAPDREIQGLWIAVGVLILGVLGGATLLWWRRRQEESHGVRTDLADIPLSVSHLVKTYADGHRAVNDVSWQARRGQVVGLLGPNGAGKTTTIRMIVGLISPDSGEVHVHGRPIRAGSASLAGIGALIEGPGFLPHLTGRANLEAYWDATGRPRSEACFDEALEVAALGGAVDRPVKSYSQGMRQRLGIAQAMLGMPEVLLLDEPTNGLDPPQIAAMRPVLARYAATGRTVVVSSHLLAEVEMTCTHVVVMNQGKVVLSGEVNQLVESADTTLVEVDADEPACHLLAEQLTTALSEVDPQTSVTVTGAGSLSVQSTASRDHVIDVIRTSGTAITSVTGRRHLEEVFLQVIAAEDVEAARQVRPR